MLDQTRNGAYQGQLYWVEKKHLSIIKDGMQYLSEATKNVRKEQENMASRCCASS